MVPIATARLADDLLGVDSVLGEMLETLRDLTLPRTSATTVGAFDVGETADAMVLRLAVPGAKPADVDVRVTGDTLEIDVTSEDRSDDVRWLERRIPRFDLHRRIRLPSSLDTEGVDAHLHDGILEIRVPKVRSSRTRTIEIRSDDTS